MQKFSKWYAKKAGNTGNTENNTAIQYTKIYGISTTVQYGIIEKLHCTTTKIIFCDLLKLCFNSLKPKNSTLHYTLTGTTTQLEPEPDYYYYNKLHTSISQQHLGFTDMTPTTRSRQYQLAAPGAH